LSHHAGKVQKFELRKVAKDMAAEEEFGLKASTG
jgi:hypothetical protein